MSAAAQRISWFPGSRLRNLFWISDALFLPLSFAWKPRPLITQRDAAEKICSRPGERLWRCRIHAISLQYSTFSAKINGFAEESTL
jgi:hypothetical protein